MVNVRMRICLVWDGNSSSPLIKLVAAYMLNFLESVSGEFQYGCMNCIICSM